ncbi:MAG: RNA methyltransferase [Flavobacteriales bacterium]|nr:RNA methyltransferase [Flavobacteriales bacterium]
MINKSDIKHIRSLHQKKFREQHKQFIVEGPKMVREIIANNVPINALYSTENEPLYENLPNFHKIKSSEMGRISALKNPSSALALLPYLNTEYSPLPKEELYLGLDHIQDPGNLGTIIRTCDWFGVKTVICSEDTVEKYNPKVIQASMGSIFRVIVEYVDLLEYCNKLKNNDIDIFGTTLSGEQVTTVNAPKKGLLLIGNESRGLSSELLGICTHERKIPRLGGSESLNAAVACGIFLNYAFHS